MSHREYRWVLICAFAAIAAQAPAQNAKTVRGRVVMQGTAAARPSTPVPPRQSADTLPAQVSDAEFWRMISEFSEPGGSYPYENFVSNEWRQQTVIPALLAGTRRGEVYIGVGPEQNFTYAAALRAKMAFVIDIRRQNMLELLMYKALFELAPNRADFVSRLFSRSRPPGLNDQTSVEALFASYEKVKNDANLYRNNLEAIKNVLKRHGFQLTADDEQRIEYVYGVFYRGGPAINYSFASVSPAVNTPSYTQVMTMSDVTGRRWSFLAAEESFQYIREMHRKNLFVPLVGDFSGPRAIRNVARYLKAHNANVGAFYASNVESYLDEAQTRAFYGSLLSLPTDSTTMCIRYVDFMHSASLPSWALDGSYIQVVSPMSDLSRLASGGRTPAYPDLLRLINDPAPGSAAPRLSMSMRLEPAGRVMSVVIDPQPNGDFQVSLPVGTLRAGVATAWPTGYTVKSMKYGSSDALREPLNITPSDTAELVITLGK